MVRSAPLPDNPLISGFGPDGLKRNGEPPKRRDRFPGGTVKYTRQAAATVLEHLANGDTLPTAIRKYNATVPHNKRFSASTFRHWINNPRRRIPGGKTLGEAYREAREFCAELQLDLSVDAARDRDREPKCREVEAKYRQQFAQMTAPGRFGRNAAGEGGGSGPLIEIVVKDGQTINVTPRTKALPNAD